MQTTNINWTDKVWNPVTGCTKVSAGCKNCYAEIIANRFWKDREFGRVKMHHERIAQVFNKRKSSKIFVNSMSDLFHSELSDNEIAKIFAAMHIADNQIFQVLTKRIERAQKLLYISSFTELICIWANDLYDRHIRTLDGCLYPIDEVESCMPLKNLWLGVSIENQKTADERIPILLETPAEIHWLSIEPLLEDIDLDTTQLFDNKMRGRHTIDWIVIGCESGPKKRECKTEWISKIVWACQQAKIKVWVKQININGKVVEDINQFPKHLQVRELPG